MPHESNAKLYYGWWITITLAVTETVSWGVIFYAFSVFITSHEADFGWSRSQITGAFSLALLVMAGMSFPVGWVLDRYGGRVLMTTGSIMGTALIFSLAYINTLPLFYIAWALLGMTAAMVFYEPSFVIVARWFQRYRPRALAVITFAAGFASTIFLPLTDYLIRNVGREQAWMVLALILGAITIPLHGLVLRRSPESLGLAVDGVVWKVARGWEQETAVTPAITIQQAVRQTTFWWFAFAFGLATLSLNAIRIHFIPFLVDANYSPEFAAWLGGFIGAMQVAGRLAFAPIGERISLKLVVMVIFAIQGISIAILHFFLTTVGIWVFVILLGASAGALTLVRTAMLADLYSGQNYGRISSLQATIMRLATMSAPIGASLLYAATGNSYRFVLPILALLPFVSVAAIWRIEP